MAKVGCHAYLVTGKGRNLGTHGANFLVGLSSLAVPRVAAPRLSIRNDGAEPGTSQDLGTEKSRNQGTHGANFLVGLSSLTVPRVTAPGLLIGNDGHDPGTSQDLGTEKRRNQGIHCPSLYVCHRTEEHNSEPQSQ